MRACRGSVTIGGVEVANRSAGYAIAQGVAHVPEDRTGVGSSPNLSVTDNLIMKRYKAAPVAHGWLMDDTAARTRPPKASEPPSTSRRPRSIPRPGSCRAATCSGSSWPVRSTPGRELMVAAQPTRGLDVGAIEAIHRILFQRRAEGTAILLISEDLDEILAVADRVDVMYEGWIAGLGSIQRRQTSTRSGCSWWAAG